MASSTRSSRRLERGQYAQLQPQQRSATTFRLTTWDPILIVAQIVALQTAAYVSLSLLVTVLLLFSATTATVDQILDYRQYTLSTAIGWALSSLWIFQCLLNVGLLLVVVERAKLCLDFSATFVFIHLLFTWRHSDEFPRSLSWWLIIGLGLAIMAGLGEWVCMRKELKPIKIIREAVATVVPPGDEEGEADDDDDGDGNSDSDHDFGGENARGGRRHLGPFVTRSTRSMGNPSSGSDVIEMADIDNASSNSGSRLQPDFVIDMDRATIVSPAPRYKRQFLNKSDQSVLHLQSTPSPVAGTTSLNDTSAHSAAAPQRSSAENK